MKYVIMQYGGENDEIYTEDIIIREITGKEFKDYDADYKKEHNIAAIIPLDYFAHLVPFFKNKKAKYARKIELEFTSDDGTCLDSQKLEIGDIEHFDNGSIPWYRVLTRITVLG
jgi:hypothetical protein